MTLVRRWARAGELGNVQEVHSNFAYSGCALSVIDALSTLAVLGDSSNFEASVNWLVQTVSAHPPLICQLSLMPGPVSSNACNLSAAMCCVLPHLNLDSHCSERTSRCCS